MILSTDFLVGNNAFRAEMLPKASAMMPAMANRTPAKIVCDDQSAESIPNFSYPILTPEKALPHNAEQMNASRITAGVLVKIFYLNFLLNFLI